MRISRLTLICIAFLLFAVVPVQAAPLSVHEGEWEITMETSFEGVEDMPYAMPAQKIRTTQCITKDNLVPENKTKDADNCTIKEQKISGNTVRWKIVCVDKEGRSEGEGEITYSGTSYKGTIKTTVTEKDGERITTKTKLSGRRLGPCGTSGAVPAKNDAQARIDAAKQATAAYSANEKLAREIVALTIPNEIPGACQVYTAGGAFNAACNTSQGVLNLTEGQWNTSRETAQKDKFGHVIYAGKTEKSECLTRDHPIPFSIGDDSAIKEAKRSKNKLTFKIRGETGEQGKGYLSFNGTRYEGVMMVKYPDSMGGFTHVSKLRGTRSGECEISGRGYTAQGRGYTARGRDYTSQKKGLLDVPLPQPVKKLRNIMGF